jgi:hypothetical protein
LQHGGYRRHGQEEAQGQGGISETFHICRVRTGAVRRPAIELVAVAVKLCLTSTIRAARTKTEP